MPAKIKHIAIVSDQYALEGRFYEAVFGMRTAADRRPERAVTVSDGYVGLNINPRKAGRPAGLDHFGVEVEDAERVCARLRERYPAIEVLKRPGREDRSARRRDAGATPASNRSLVDDPRTVARGHDRGRILVDAYRLKPDRAAR